MKLVFWDPDSHDYVRSVNRQEERNNFEETNDSVKALIWEIMRKQQEIIDLEFDMELLISDLIKNDTR